MQKYREFLYITKTIVLGCKLAGSVIVDEVNIRSYSMNERRDRY